MRVTDFEERLPLLQAQPIGSLLRMRATDSDKALPLLRAEPVVNLRWARLMRPACAAAVLLSATIFAVLALNTTPLPGPSQPCNASALPVTDNVSLAAVFNLTGLTFRGLEFFGSFSDGNIQRGLDLEFGGPAHDPARRTSDTTFPATLLHPRHALCALTLYLGTIQGTPWYSPAPVNASHANCWKGGDGRESCLWVHAVFRGCQAHLKTYPADAWCGGNTPHFPGCGPDTCDPDARPADVVADIVAHGRRGQCAFPGTARGTEQLVQTQNMLCNAHVSPGDGDGGRSGNTLCGVGYPGACQENQRQLWWSAGDVVAFAFVDPQREPAAQAVRAAFEARFHRRVPLVFPWYQPCNPGSGLPCPADAPHGSLRFRELPRAADR